MNINNMDIEINEGFNLIYAKKLGRPKNIYLENRRQVVEFLIEKTDDIDLLSINGVVIDVIKLINSNQILSRYLKLSKINELL